MQLLMESIESLQQETYKLLGYERNLAKQQQIKQQFIQKRVTDERHTTVDWEFFAAQLFRQLP